jgi:hypothetical protein
LDFSAQQPKPLRVLDPIVLEVLVKTFFVFFRTVYKKIVIQTWAADLQRSKTLCWVRGVADLIDPWFE